MYCLLQMNLSNNLMVLSNKTAVVLLLLYVACLCKKFPLRVESR